MTPLPGFWEVARRPQWIGVLVACLIVAAIFGVLANWQTARAVEQGQGDDRDTETPVTLESVHEPQAILTTEAGGRIVTAVGVVQPDDFMVLEGRQQEGDRGCWVIGRAVIAEGAHTGASLAFAAEFVPECEGVDGELQRLRDAADGSSTQLAGRYMPSEAPQMVDFDEGRMAMSIAWLINVWEDYEPPIYAGYMILHDPENPAESLSIHSVRPEQSTDVNWLNVFYAIEWVAFAGFAFYLWYRMVQDAREREAEPDDDDDFDDADDDFDDLDPEPASGAEPSILAER